MNGGPAVNQDPRRDLPSVDRLAAQVRADAPEIPAWADLPKTYSIQLQDPFSNMEVTVQELLDPDYLTYRAASARYLARALDALGIPQSGGLIGSSRCIRASMAAR